MDWHALAACEYSPQTVNYAGLMLRALCLIRAAAPNTCINSVSAHAGARHMAAPVVRMVAPPCPFFLQPAATPHTGHEPAPVASIGVSMCACQPLACLACHVAPCCSFFPPPQRILLGCSFFRPPQHMPMRCANPHSLWDSNGLAMRQSAQYRGRHNITRGGLASLLTLPRGPASHTPTWFSLAGAHQMDGQVAIYMVAQHRGGGCWLEWRPLQF